MIHLATSRMGFGGVGYSGMGSYHGKLSFDTFTHYRSIVKKSNRIDLPMRYHPYREKNLKVIRMLIR
jgi:aldehyde dehydrogenase (NAD+)